MKQRGVELQVASPATLNINMQVTGGTVTVEVSGTAPLVNTQDASMGHAFGADQIADLPFEGRDPGGILSLQTGVVFTRQQPAHRGSSDSRAGSVNRSTQRQTNITLDGSTTMISFWAPRSKVQSAPLLTSLEELKVTTSNSDADTGRSSGARFLVTKSGTNHIHGSLYAYNRSSIGQAK